MEFGGDWTFDSLIKLDSGTLCFYDCIFRENETKATRLTSHTYLFSTTEGAPTNTELLLKNCLILSNNIGCGGWVTNLAGGGGGIINAAGQIDRSTLVNNSIYTSASLSGLGTRYVINRMRATNLVVWSNNTLSAPYWNSANSTTTYNEPSAVYSTNPVGFSFVDIKGTNTVYTSALTNFPLFVNAAAGNFDPATNSPVINAGDPASPKDPDGSRADIGYSSSRNLSGTNWINALPSFTNNSFTGGTFTQWEVFSGSGVTSVPILNAADAVDGKEAQLKDWTYGVTILSPAFVCGEGWRARARYRNPQGISSCGFVVYDSGRNLLMTSNLEDDPYTVKEYDLSRFAGQTIKVGFSGGDVRADYVDILAPAGSSTGNFLEPGPVITNQPVGLTTNTGANVSFSVAALNPGTNILSNSSFESGLTNWTTYGGTISTTNLAFSGSTAAVLNKDISGGYGRLRYSTDLNWPAGSLYLISSKIYNSFSGQDGYDLMTGGSGYTGDYNIVNLGTRRPEANTNWVEYRWVLSAKTTSTRSLNLLNYFATGGTYIVDDFELRPCTTNGLTYEWQKDGAVITNQTSATLSLTNLQTNQAGSYRVVVSSTYGSVTSSLASLTVGSPPVITSPNSFTGTVGVYFTNNFTVTGSTPLTFSASSIPTWLNLNTSGSMYGTPTSAGTSASTLTASNSFGSPMDRR
ncbi:MAG: hypothetical protein EBS69_08490 [Verrucomicrobia bacterium]|nr:hypothetical protein [Verrucomicrobiota bacterium]